MSVAEIPERCPGADGERVRDLLRRCGQTRDRAERAALLARMAYELERAAEEISAHAGECGTDRRELVATLQGQAGMARFVAGLERSDRARR